MAKANSTPRLVGEDSKGQIPPATPSPMLCHSDDATEATNSVRNVLYFMACALREGFDFAGDEKLLDGAGLILETCAETLSHYLPIREKGGSE